ncbi:NUDIX domain-containing protein [Stackebrandtia soli]|uniref:NUDIX domain-containing protein n=1 Tax=Stackebrandtia soli TaxID=1892856 RepID=UPI0039E99DF3
MTTKRPGFGIRDEAASILLAAHTPIATMTTVWANGAMPLRCSAFDGPASLPDHLSGSVRCLVRVGGELVCCENEGGTHPWPGGRAEPGESIVETAVREVHEETGWFLLPDSVRVVGWLHYEHQAPMWEDYRLPYPDFFQTVVVGRADRRDAGHVADLDGGYEQRHWLESPETVPSLPRMTPLAAPFLRYAFTED